MKRHEKESKHRVRKREKERNRSNSSLFVYISDFFDGVKVKFFHFISKQIPYFVSLNTLVLESKKISWELIFYFSMKIKNSDHRGTLYIHFCFFRGSQS